MISLKNRFPQIYRLPKVLLAVAALGLTAPGFSQAQTAAGADSLPLAKQHQETPVLPDGTYLFGQNPQPDEIGFTYAVFSIKNNQTVGAFYQPRSSFDCFSGQTQPDRLAVNIVDSYTQTVHPYNVALTLNNSLVAGSGAGSYTLEGFHRLESLSAQDAEMLAVCTADMVQ